MNGTSIRDSLMEQLQAKGADVAHFRSLIEDYVWMDEQLQAMKEDIKERGTRCLTLSASGKPYEKENPAVKDAVMYSRQMLAILRDLGLSTEKTVVEDDDEL